MSGSLAGSTAQASAPANPARAANTTRRELQSGVRPARVRSRRGPAGGVGGRRAGGAVEPFSRRGGIRIGIRTAPSGADTPRCGQRKPAVASGCLLSRRPDSNRRPLHYEAARGVRRGAVKWHEVAANTALLPIPHDRSVPAVTGVLDPVADPVRARKARAGELAMTAVTLRSRRTLP
jgi:hypothetical protein